MRTGLLLFLLTTLFANYAMEVGNAVVELHDTASVFNSKFINSTKLHKLQFIYPVTAFGYLDTSRISALESNWNAFRQKLLYPVEIKEVVTIERLKDLEDIWLSNCQQEQFCENPYSFKNGDSLLLLALFILNDGGDKKKLEDFAQSHNVFAQKNFLQNNVVTDLLPQKRKNSCLLQ